MNYWDKKKIAWKAIDKMVNDNKNLALDKLECVCIYIITSEFGFSSQFVKKRLKLLNEFNKIKLTKVDEKLLNYPIKEVDEYVRHIKFKKKHNIQEVSC